MSSGRVLGYRPWVGWVGLGMVLYISESVCSIYIEINSRAILLNTTSRTHADEARIWLGSTSVLPNPWTLNAWVC